jgi:prepilin-type N-terminal cleavage/methylation domain-containing protein
MWAQTAGPRRAGANVNHGFSLIEVLVAVGIFLVVSVGTLSILGATAAGGFQETSLTALSTARRAKDLTVAAVYLQGLHDYLASLDDSAWDAVLGDWAPGTTGQSYCIQPGRLSCDGGEPVPPPALGVYPIPSSAQYQLPWTALRIIVQRWTWDCATRRFSLTPLQAAPDLLLRLHTVLSWRVKDDLRTLAPSGGGLDRFLAYRPALITPEEVCP